MSSTFKNEWRWAGHIAREKDNRWTKRCTEWQRRSGRRDKGRPRRWIDDIRRAAGPQWQRNAQDRRKWKTSAEGYILQWMDKASKHPKALLRNAAGENFVVLIRLLFGVTKLQKVKCQMIANELQAHSEAACEAVAKPSEESYQSEKRSCLSKTKIVGLLENSQKRFCVSMVLSNQAPSSHCPCASDVLAPAAAVP
ncbi:endonuclease-reverse transcriptase [Plakobranchus ocellatus]|uniref:Endonuclease-reverse transcriptase n=1 Tax=Plakobranchus ocellatus TaxID=259542 RepID=A0AAV4BZS2_9GAST|nr:endonuclease-reverse transcriptase [Plakobranchus ocellatus]